MKYMDAINLNVKYEKIPKIDVHVITMQNDQLNR